MMESSVFDRIAPGWYNFRHWPIMRAELETMRRRWRNGRLLNLGCAHGPDFLPFVQDFELHGIDFSGGMLRQAQRYADKLQFEASLVRADLTHLPYAGGAFDQAISVAAYHHLKPGQQADAVSELRRVLKPGGEAFVTVWNRWQRRFWFRGRETMVPWRTGEDRLMRYYYLFSRGELQRLFSVGGFEVLRSFPEASHRLPQFLSRNICLLVRRD